VVLRVNDHVGILVRAGCVPSGAVAQKVNAALAIRNSQPSGFSLIRCRQRWRLHERVLHHILAVDDRAGHARAVAMQLGPQFAEQPIARRARFN
jgi:hypothetical protein